MHNTRSAIASLVNQYKAVLKTCHILNTFGSLAVAASLVVPVCTAVGTYNVECAYASDFGVATGTEEVYSITELSGVSPAYIVVSDKGEAVFDSNDYYKTFRIFAFENEKLAEIQYGVLLKKNGYDESKVKDTTTNSITMLIEDYLTSQKPTIAGNGALQSAYSSLLLGNKSDALYNGRILYDGDTIGYYVVKNDSVTPLSIRTENHITSPTNSASVISSNYANIKTIDKESLTQYAQYNGGAVYIYSDQSGTVAENITIQGDFIGNEIEGQFSNIYQGNGGAIGLFANKSGASIKVEEIKGDFISNSASRVGGAIYLFTNNGAKTEATVINGAFIGNTAALGGGAVANYEGAIGDINGTFIGNVAKAGGGGAVDNMMWSLAGGHTATITSISGNFIGNTAGTDTAIANGGAVRNFAYSYTENANIAGEATIAAITANFIGNNATGDGGAIYNYAHSSADNINVENIASIEIITGDFIGNSAGSSGGAIYNDDNYSSEASIGSITGDFIANTSGMLGGALYNTSTIGTDASNVIAITGNFVNNIAGEEGGYVAIGGAIYNFANGKTAVIGNIDADFIGNRATATLGLGGAIANYAGDTGTTATIGNITGDFIGNQATRYGGAIYNDSNAQQSATIGTITGNFLHNSVQESSGSDSTHATAKAQGGAIYNNDTIGVISGSFVGNYVTSTSTNVDVKGGAIYTTANMDFEANNQTNYFSDNYVVDDGVAYNAIYVDIDNIIHNALQNDINLKFTMSGNGNVVMNDSISGNTTYTPLTNTDYSGSKLSASASDANGTITIANDSDELSRVSGTSKVTSTAVTNTYVQSETTNGSTTTTTTVVIATTTYTNGNAGIPTYSSSITIKDADGNVTTATYAEDKTGGLDSDADVTKTTSASTTYSIDGTIHGESATYTTANDGTITSAKVVTVDKDGTSTTTTYTDSGDDKAVLVSDAGKSTDMTGDTAYNVNILGMSKDKNTFTLCHDIENFGDFTISNATLYLSQYMHENGTVTKGGLCALDAQSSVTFGKHSQLIIDMSAYQDSIGTHGQISSIAVLKGNGAKLFVDESSKLHLANASTGDTYTILSGFNALADDVQNGYAWSEANVSVESSLQTVIIRDGVDDTKDEVNDSTPLKNVLPQAFVMTDTAGTSGSTVTDVYYVVSIIADPEDSALADSSVGDIIINAANTAGFGPNASDAGNRFVFDVSTVDGERNQVAAAEGAANIAKVSGVPTTTYRVNRLSSDALSTRLNGSANTGAVLTTAGGDDDGLGELSKKYESMSLWFVPMYGHDVTDGAGLAGFNADFHTNIYGGVVGIDKTVDNDGANGLAADLYRVGVALNMGGGDTSASGDFDAIENRFNFGGAFVYGVAEYGKLTLSADAGFNKIMSEVNQDLSRHGIAGTKADVNSFAWSADLQAQYRFEGDTVDVIPYAGLGFVSMKTDDYNVVRADFAGGTVFTVASDRQNIFSVPVGVKFDGQWTAFDDWLITPQISLGAIFAMGDLDEQSSITMPNVAGSGHASMQVVDEVTFDMSTGLSIANDVWTFGLDYELQMSEHHTGHALVGLVQYKF